MPTRERLILLVAWLVVGCGDSYKDDWLERITAWRHQSVNPRRRELVLLGAVRDSGRRRPTRSGRKAIVWVVVEGV